MDIAAYVAVGTVGVILAPPLIVPVLHMIGFGVGGPVAASMAVGIQSGIGNVVAGSVFATAQAIGATTVVPAGIAAAVAGAGGVTTALGWAGLRAVAMPVARRFVFGI